MSGAWVRGGLSVYDSPMQIMRLDTVVSTMDVCRELAADGAAELCAVVAREQTAGRGRYGRVWFSPPGASIYGSILLRPSIGAERLNWLTMLGALAVLDAITPALSAPSAPAVPAQARLKWFNDVVFDGRKLAGVLMESAWLGDRLDYAILGIGVNVNTDFSTASADIQQRATSVRSMCGAACDLEAILARLLHAIESRYRALIDEGRSPLAEYVSALETLGRTVRMSAGEEQLAGRAVGVDDDGALIVQTPRGRRRLTFGDVAH